MREVIIAYELPLTPANLEGRGKLRNHVLMTAVIETIGKESGESKKVARTTWIVKTSLPLKDIHSMLWEQGQMRDNDKLVVAEYSENTVVFR